MSHFAVLVIGANINEQLAPYDENIEAAPYPVEVSEDEIKRMVDYYKRNGIEYPTIEELVSSKGVDWGGCEMKRDTDGKWVRMSTYNPKSKWDWYEIGGRYAARLRVKEGVEFEEPNFSWGWDENVKKEVLSKRLTDSALVKDIENLDELSAYAVVKDGNWYEKGEMGWFGISTNEVSDEEWRNELKKLLTNLSDDTLITYVDCHI